MMKKLLAVVIVTALAVSAAACGKEYQGTYSYKLEDYVKLGEYKGLTYSSISAPVTDEMVQHEIQFRVQSAADDPKNKKTIEKGQVETGDTANIDFEGKLDGKPFEGGTSKGFDLTIGSGQFIPGFEEKLIGVPIGSTVDLNLTFPEDYHSAELAGKDVVFTVKVNKVSRGKPGVYDEAFIKANSKAATKEEYEKLVREELEKDGREYAEEEAKGRLWNQLMENASFESLPEEAVEAQKKRTEEYYAGVAARNGAELKEFLKSYMGMDEKAFKKYTEDYARTIVEQELVLYAIAKAENISVTDGEYRKQLKKALKQQGYESPEDFKKKNGVSFEESAGKENLQKSFLLQEVLDFIVKNSVEVKSGGEKAGKGAGPEDGKGKEEKNGGAE